MSLARAFTTRRAKQSLDLRDAASDGNLHRSNTVAKAGISALRHKISAPVELIHTTNMLSYNAPDIYPKKESSSSSAKSDDESDSAQTAASTPPTSPDSPFPEKRSLSPEPNHLSCYFTPPKHALAEQPATATAAGMATDAPAIPQRAPSHTKKSYEGLGRHRSASRLSEQSTRSLSTKASFTFSRSSSSSTSTSVTSVSHNSASHMSKPSTLLPSAITSPAQSSTPPVSHKNEYSESHPFGHELTQVSELAEEFGVKEKMSIVDEEEQDLLRKGLCKFSAEDYLGEIQGLFTSFFADVRPIAAVWI